MNLLLTKFFRDYLLARVFYILLFLLVVSPILGIFIKIESLLPGYFQNYALFFFVFIATTPIIGVIGYYWKKVFNTLSTKTILLV